VKHLADRTGGTIAGARWDGDRIAPTKKMRAHYVTGDSTRFTVNTEKAIVVTGLARRPPEPQPGRIVPIAIRLKRSHSGLFAALAPQP
jgi:hypothetical protein